jgi:hypothetical protein
LPDDKIVVAGETQSADGTVSEFPIARFKANGGLDSTFGTGGKVTANFFAAQAGASAIPRKPDGTIVAIGQAIRNHRELST